MDGGRRASKSSNSNNTPKPLTSMVLGKQYQRLHRALRNGYVNVNAALEVQIYKMTPLEFSVYFRDIRMASILLWAGADPSKNVFDGRKHLPLAAEVLPGFQHVGSGQAIAGFDGLRAILDDGFDEGGYAHDEEMDIVLDNSTIVTDSEEEEGDVIMTNAIQHQYTTRTVMLNFIWLVEICKGKADLVLPHQFRRVVASLQSIFPYANLGERLKRIVYETLLICSATRLPRRASTIISKMVIESAIWSLIMAETMGRMDHGHLAAAAANTTNATDRSYDEIGESMTMESDDASSRQNKQKSSTK